MTATLVRDTIATMVFDCQTYAEWLADQEDAKRPPVRLDPRTLDERRGQRWQDQTSGAWPTVVRDA